MVSFKQIFKPLSSVLFQPMKRISVLFGTTEDALVDCWSKEIELQFCTEFLFDFVRTSKAEEIIRIVQERAIQILIYHPNNLSFTLTPSAFNLLRQLKKRYKMQVICISGFPPYRKDAHNAGADFFIDLAFGYAEHTIALDRCVRRLSKPWELRRKEKKINIVLDPKLTGEFCGLFERWGFKVLWVGPCSPFCYTPPHKSCCVHLSQLERLIEREHVDLAIEFQHHQGGVDLRNIVWSVDGTIPVFTAPSCNGKARPDYREFLLAGYVDFPFLGDELADKFFSVLPEAKKPILKELPIWKRQE